MIQLNDQAVDQPSYRKDGVLDVHSIFYTIQGEGPFAGLPAVFVRLYGCNLQCPGCDTDYTSKRQYTPPEALVDEIEKQFWTERGSCLPSIKVKKPLVVITGGEPFRQNLFPAIRKLVAWGFINVQIETNGTLGWPDWELPIITTTIVCSPKKSYVNENLRPLVKHLKYVVEADHISEEDGLPTTTMGYGGQVARPWSGFTGTVWLQPFDAQDPDQNRKNIAAAVTACKRFGYRMSLQTHKILGVE